MNNLVAQQWTREKGTNWGPIEYGFDNPENYKNPIWHQVSGPNLKSEVGVVIHYTMVNGEIHLENF